MKRSIFDDEFECPHSSLVFQIHPFCMVFMFFFFQFADEIVPKSKLLIPCFFQKWYRCRPLSYCYNYPVSNHTHTETFTGSPCHTPHQQRIHTQNFPHTHTQYTCIDVTQCSRPLDNPIDPLYHNNTVINRFLSNFRKQIFRLALASTPPRNTDEHLYICLYRNASTKI